jgi:Yip1-like protein
VPTTNSFLQRLVGAAALDRAIYEDVEADRGATAQAFIVVVLSSIAWGVGYGGLTGGPVNIAFFSMVALLSWAAWALVTYAVGALLLPEAQTKADVGELLRTTGFAATPGLLGVLGFMAPLAKPVFAVTAVWMLVAMIVAVRQALDYTSTTRAVAVCIVGWVLAIGFAVAFGLMFAPTVS